MGATKLLAEKLISDATNWKGLKKTIFSNVRFGNVLFSRGSVIPIFEYQIKNNKNITITDPEMTRFFMSIMNTVELVFKATLMQIGGEVFIFKMPVVRLGDLADVVIKEYTKKYNINPKDVEKEIIGARPGEKRYEELLTEEEAKIAYETKDMIIIPYKNRYTNIKQTPKDYKDAEICKLKKYISKDLKPYDKSQIKNLIFG
jgi:FlaA1/EpsC-like NDP-sugar epimerase